jgi:hypothetical protein
MRNSQSRVTSRKSHIATTATVAAALAFAIAIISTATIDAHKGITSKYTYNDDVYPILRDKCGRCHAEGGPAPMSLLRFSIDAGGAAAWAESIRENLVSEAMPPWYVDPTGPAVKNNRGLTARELDTIVTWATGGTPQGNLNKKPLDAPISVNWTLGKPDVSIPMPKPFTLGPGVMQDTLDASLPTNFTEAKWVRAVDLLPSTPTMVRRATISLENGPVLAVWEPGDEAVATPGGTAFKIPAGANLHLQVAYKKNYLDEQQTKTDTSTVGLYLTDEPLSGKSIQSFAVDAPSSQGGDALSFTGALSTGGRVLALRPQVDQPYASVSIEAVAASGKRVPLLKLRGVRPEWPRRYWLTDPVELPSGTKIEVKLVPGDPNSGPLTAPVKSPLQIGLDFVPQ